MAEYDEFDHCRQDDELREAGKFVFDFSDRKICVYPNSMGDVVLMVEEDGQRVYTSLSVDEVQLLQDALTRIALEAKPITDEIEAEYQAHEAMLNAKEGRGYGK